MDRVLTGVLPDRERMADLTRRAEWRRRKAAARARVAVQLADALHDNASDLRRRIAALQGAGLGVDLRVIEGLQACADDIEAAAAVVVSATGRSAA